jgi:predicted anti-sigma-YlaC factor YlaD
MSKARNGGRTSDPAMASERTLTCLELTEVLTDYLEGAMASTDVARFEAHLDLCEGCVYYVSQMRHVIRATRELHVSMVEATASDDLLEAFRAWKREAPDRARPPVR